ncbi:MAG: DMT family transporter [Moorea sp. SIO1G6]|nr:DMT family transporter [Moorena sp. SIO2B7]NET69396.1 DMT family transporter [Moorena sp. SIO1G6]
MISENSMSNPLEKPQQKSEITTTTLAFFALILAVVSLSMAGLFIRLSQREIGSIAIAFNRLWIATLAFGLLNGINSISTYPENSKSQKQKTYTLGRIGLLLSAATVASVSLLMWNWSLAQTNVANATLMRNFNAMFTPLLGWILFGQRYDRKFLIGMVVAIAGIITIGLEDVKISLSHLQGDIEALMSALGISVFLLIVEQLRSRFSTTTIMLWRCGIGTLLILPIFLLTQDGYFPYSVIGWLAVIAQAIVCQCLGQGLLVYSLKRLSSGFISLVVPLEVVFATMAAWFVFSEKISVFNWFGFAVVLLGIYLAKSSLSTLKPMEKN